MPLNNVLNKTSDTFIVNPISGGTANITAGFTSLRTSTSTLTGTYTNFLASLSQGAESGLNLIYIGDDITYQPLIQIASAGGTIASRTARSTCAYAMDWFVRSSSNIYRTISYTFTIMNSNGFHETEFNVDGISVLRWENANNIITQRKIRFNGHYTFDPTKLPTNASVKFNVSTFANQQSGMFAAYTTSGLTLEQCIGLSHFNFSASTNQGASLVLVRSRNSTPALTTKVELNDEISQLVFAGADGTTTAKLLATIKCFADGTTGNNDVPGRIVYSTTPDGSSTPSEAMRTDNAGRTTQVRQPSFSASLSADVAAATGDGTAYVVAFDTEQYDQGNNFATNTFTAPVAGKYRFNYIVSVDDLLVGHTKMEVTIGGVVVERCNPYALADSDGFYLCAGGIDLSLAASATVTMVITVSGSTKTVTVKGTTTSGTFLSGQLQV